MVEEARKIYDATPTSIAALGRSLSAAGMMSKMLKDDKAKLTFRINGTSDIKSIIVVAKPNGDVKGYISNPYVDRPLKVNGKLDVGGAIGSDGELFVIVDYDMKEPYVGKSELVTGEIAEDLAHYYVNSEQLSSVVALGVFVNSDEEVIAAGGLILQPLPDASEQTIQKLEQSIGDMDTITSMMNNGLTGEEIIGKALGDLEFDIVERDEIRLKCDCSRERMEEALISMKKEELEDILQNEKKAEVHCHFCNTTYEFTEEDLRNIIKNIEELNNS
jgi:molecular chaperone Hsp33